MTEAGQPNSSARARAAARRAIGSLARMARTPPAKSSPVTAIPAVPTTSGSALDALTTTGVPQASASSAASPNVSTGPGATTTSTGVTADKYTAVPLSANGRLAAFYAPESTPAQPSNGVGDIFLTNTPF